ncbi:MAG: hypothetical protein Q8Q06_00005, partial [bacterium]|nr:hypothetical protein [bacterium]
MAYTQKIKIYFSIIFIILVSAMIAGIFMVKRFYFDTTQYLKTAAIEIEYQKYIGEETEPVALSVMLSPFRALKNTWVVQGKNGKTGETATSVPVLIYHGILKDEDASGFNISIDKFKDQMFALKKAGYETITSETLYKYMKEGLELPEKSIVITFDDGRLDSLYNGNPTLKALDYQAIMF